MRAWIDRTNDGLSGMPADGISLPPKRGDFGTSRWAGSKARLHQPGDWAEGGMTACGTSWPEHMRWFVRSWRKQTCERSGGIRVLTQLRHGRLK
jgi:hypothetical protein